MNFGDIEKALGFSVGFDQMFDRLLGDFQLNVANNSTNFPPYNIRKDGDTKYFIEMAVAGLSEDDLEVELKEGILSVRSKQSEKEEAEYVHRGIAKRMFERSFTLSDDVIVQGCGLVNGMLTIELERVIPEDKKSRIIPIDNTKV
jgi:molecular chaperone IbpA